MNIRIGSGRPHPELSRLSELDRVAQQVHQDLRHAPLVSQRDRKVRLDLDVEVQPLLGRQGFHRADDSMDHVAEGVILERQRQLARFDLGQVEHIVDEIQQMTAALLHPFQHVADRLGHLSVDPIDDELRVAQDRVERGAQLVAHVGEELRLVLAGDLQLPALLLDLAEQARILDRQGRLLGKGLQQLHDFDAEIVPVLMRASASAPNTRPSRSSGRASTARSPA